MKRSLLAAAFMLSGGAAFAGGYVAPVEQAEPIVVTQTAAAPGMDWTGFYAGLQYGQGDLEGSYGGISADAGDFDAIGLHGGYNRDFGKYVLGAELDYNKVELDDADLDGDLVRLKGRAGADLGRFMPYVTLGVAHLSGDDDSETGFMYGLGADFMATEKFVVGLEYANHEFDDVGGVDGLDAEADLLQVRASYRF